MGILKEILIADSPEHEMRSVATVVAEAGKGLVGDRYHKGTGTFSPSPHKADFEITLIENEKVEEFAMKSGLPFTASDARRNLVTEGTDLNALVDREFSIGEVKLRGIRLCEPCNYLAKQTYPEALKGLVHKGGLRAQIVKGGTLTVGMQINSNNKEAPAGCNSCR